VLKPPHLTIELLVQKFVRHLAILAGVALIFLMLLIVYAVVMRYIFNSPILWALDCARVGLVVLVFFGLAYCGLTGGHIAVDFLGAFASPRTVQISDIIIRSICFLLVGLMAWQSMVQGLDALDLGEGTNELEIPLFPFFVVAALGSVAYCAVLVIQVKRAMCGQILDDHGES